MVVSQGKRQHWDFRHASEKDRRKKKKAKIKWGSDDRQTTLASNKGDIAIKWEDLSPFVSDVTKKHSTFAYVLSLPEEFFNLKNGFDVLSYEAWETCLSNSEKDELSMFLPEGLDSDQVVKSLLTGENLHFGNTFSKWNASLCSGNLHPDYVLRNRKRLKSSVKDYFLNLTNYNNGMKDYLLKWKIFWESCNDPEVLQEMFRQGVRDPPSSLSLPITSENVKHGSNSRKGKASKIQISNKNVTKYMSYIKISKIQHQLIMHKKHSTGGGVNSKLLKNVLGDLRGYSAQPYKISEEERDLRDNINDHWLRLAHQDVPVAYECMTKEKLLRVNMRKAFQNGIPEKWGMICCKKVSTDKQSENRKSHTYMERVTHVQMEDGESRHQAEINFQCQKDNRCDKTPDVSSHLDNGTFMVMGGGFQDVLKPQLKPCPSSQLSGHTNFPDYCNGIIPSLSSNTLPNQREIQNISKPQSIQFCGNFKQNMNNGAGLKEPLSSASSFMRMGVQDSYIEHHSPSFNPPSNQGWDLLNHGSKGVTESNKNMAANLNQEQHRLGSGNFQDLATLPCPPKGTQLSLNLIHGESCILSDVNSSGAAAQHWGDGRNGHNGLFNMLSQYSHMPSTTLPSSNKVNLMPQSKLH